MDCCGKPNPEPPRGGLRFDVRRRRERAATGGAASRADENNADACCGNVAAVPSTGDRPCCCGGVERAAPAAGSCCGAPAAETAGSCCSAARGRPDWLLWIPLTLLAAALAAQWLAPTRLAAGPAALGVFCHAAAALARQAWWGIAAGILAVAVLARVPRELVAAALGRGHSFTGILRATAAGILLDLCNHGILLVGMQLYRKGASLGQTLAFLIASPWNSLSLTLILASLIGWKWMLAFVLLSAVIGIAAGWTADRMVAAGTLPANPNHRGLPVDFRLAPALRGVLASLVPTPANLLRLAGDGWRESRMILRWIFLGLVLAAAVRALLPDASFAAWFGPTPLGLLLTLLATTVIEVCTEGSSPIAADLLARAHAPGNAFAFLMAGAATDYTELLALRQTTGSWKLSLALPFLTVPQVLLVGWLLNHLAP